MQKAPVYGTFGGSEDGVLKLNGEFIGFSNFGENFSSKLKFEYFSHRRKYTLDYNNFSKILSHTLI